jgi:hypothetical protein
MGVSQLVANMGRFAEPKLRLLQRENYDNNSYLQSAIAYAATN